MGDRAGIFINTSQVSNDFGDSSDKAGNFCSWRTKLLSFLLVLSVGFPLKYWLSIIACSKCTFRSLCVSGAPTVYRTTHEVSVLKRVLYCGINKEFRYNCRRRVWTTVENTVGQQGGLKHEDPLHQVIHSCTYNSEYNIEFLPTCPPL